MLANSYVCNTWVKYIYQKHQKLHNEDDGKHWNNMQWNVCASSEENSCPNSQ